jgi:hypothetical protein
MDVKKVNELRGINFSYHSSGYYMINTKDKDMMNTITNFLKEQADKIETELRGELISYA